MLTERVGCEMEMLARHLLILKCVVENEPIGILKLAEVAEIPSHKVRYSLRILEHEGLIAATAPGAVTTEKTMPFLMDLDSMIDELVNGFSNLKKINIGR